MTSPWLFRPKTVGAALVVNALTKYIGGHGNALGGAVTDTGLFDWTRVPEHRRQLQDAEAGDVGHHAAAQEGAARLRRHAVAGAGASRSPSARKRSRCAWTAQCANALALARWLEAQPEVRAVHYPGLASHPQHALATTLFRALGALFSFELRDGLDRFEFLNRLRVVVLSSNLGDNRTLAIPVAQTIFYEMGAARRAEMGIAESLIRISVGIEDVGDLLADFAQAIA